ncbi:hypothetical protein Tco_0098148 [Tanacetum coccineum]
MREPVTYALMALSGVFNKMDWSMVLDAEHGIWTRWTWTEFLVLGFGIESSDISSGDETLTDSTYENSKDEKASKHVLQPTGDIFPLVANVLLHRVDELAIRNKVVNQEKTNTSQSAIDRNKGNAFNSENSESSFQNSPKHLLRTAIYMKNLPTHPKLINLRENWVHGAIQEDDLKDYAIIDSGMTLGSMTGDYGRVVDFKEVQRWFLLAFGNDLKKAQCSITDKEGIILLLIVHVCLDGKSVIFLELLGEMMSTAGSKEHYSFWWNHYVWFAQGKLRMKLSYGTETGACQLTNISKLVKDNMDDQTYDMLHDLIVGFENRSGVGYLLGYSNICKRDLESITVILLYTTSSMYCNTPTVSVDDTPTAWCFSTNSFDAERWVQTREGWDMMKSFAPVARFESIRLFWHLHLSCASCLSEDGKECILYGNITYRSVCQTVPVLEDQAHPNKVTEFWSRHFMALIIAPRAWIDEISCWYWYMLMISSLELQSLFGEGFCRSLCQKVLKHQPNLGLWYPKDSPFHLEAFSDSDYAGDNHDRRSTSGGCQYLGRRLVSWQCKKQTIVAISSTEAEYVAAASCCAQQPFELNLLFDDENGVDCFHKQDVFGIYAPRCPNIGLLRGLRVMQGIAQGTPNQVLLILKVLLSLTYNASVQGTSSLHGNATSKGLLMDIQKMLDFPRYAEPHDAASIPKSPNDYTPTDASQTSGGDEGLFRYLCF